MDLGIDGFEWKRTIGSGGFATVHAASDETHGREVAIKVLHAHADADGRRRFDRERRVMGTLSTHPNIVTVFTSGYTKDERPYIAMELVPGGSLADGLDAGPQPWSKVEPIALQLIDAVEAGHMANVIHRDIKPANVLITADQRPLLTDFGIAVVASDATLQQTVSATPAYAAPELLQGRDVDERGDIYSLAATIYALLEGKQPYGASTDGVLTVLSQIADAPVPRMVRADVPDHVSATLHAAMSKRPEHRPANAAEFRQMLSSSGAEVRQDLPPTAAPNPSKTGTSTAPTSDSRTPLLVGVGILLIAAAVGVIAWTQSMSDAVTVPDVAGQSVVDARMELMSAGFEVPQAPACDGVEVTATEPPEGSELGAGSEVSLVFEPCVAPNFVGMVLDDAIEIATTTNGISISWPNYCDDTVLGQTPAAGSVIDFDESIFLDLTPC